MKERYCGYALPHKEHEYKLDSAVAGKRVQHYFNTPSSQTYSCPGYDEDAKGPNKSKPDLGPEGRPVHNKKDKELVEFYHNSQERRLGNSRGSEEVS